GLERPGQVAPGRTRGVGARARLRVPRVVPDGEAGLGGEHDVVAAALEGLADDLLRLAAGVDVGRVDEVDPGVERPVDDLDRVLVVGVAERAEHHGAQRERADLDPGAAEGAVLHAVLLVWW